MHLLVCGLLKWTFHIFKLQFLIFLNILQNYLQYLYRLNNITENDQNLHYTPFVMQKTKMFHRFEEKTVGHPIIIFNCFKFFY